MLLATSFPLGGVFPWQCNILVFVLWSVFLAYHLTHLWHVGSPKAQSSNTIFFTILSAEMISPTPKTSLTAYVKMSHSKFISLPFISPSGLCIQLSIYNWQLPSNVSEYFYLLCIKIKSGSTEKRKSSSSSKCQHCPTRHTNHCHLWQLHLSQLHIPPIIKLCWFISWTPFKCDSFPF